MPEKRLRVVSLRLREEEVEDLKRRALSDDVTISQVIRRSALAHRQMSLLPGPEVSPTRAAKGAPSASERYHIDDLGDDPLRINNRALIK